MSTRINVHPSQKEVEAALEGETVYFPAPRGGAMQLMFRRRMLWLHKSPDIVILEGRSAPEEQGGLENA